MQSDGFEVKIKEYDLLLEEVLVTEKYNEDAKETSSGSYSMHISH